MKAFNLDYKDTDAELKLIQEYLACHKKRLWRSLLLDERRAVIDEKLRVDEAKTRKVYLDFLMVLVANLS